MMGRLNAMASAESDSQRRRERAERDARRTPTPQRRARTRSSSTSPSCSGRRRSRSRSRSRRRYERRPRRTRLDRRRRSWSRGRSVTPPEAHPDFGERLRRSRSHSRERPRGFGLSTFICDQEYGRGKIRLRRKVVARPDTQVLSNVLLDTLIDNRRLDIEQRTNAQERLSSQFHDQRGASVKLMSEWLNSEELNCIERTPDE